MESLISVIVPIYKVEKYLKKCIDSIINQTYKNLEIILVDDGSPDNCPKICDEYANEDSRVKVLHLKNGGAGYARNKGLAVASGDFVSLIDGDDYIDINMYDTLMKFAKKDVDVIECNIVMANDDNAIFDKFDSVATKVINCDSGVAMEHHIRDSIFRQTPPNKMYRRCVIKDILFPEGNLIDDEFWTYKVLGKSRKLIHIDCGLYAYRQNEGSVMHKKYSVNRIQAINAKVERLRYIESNYENLILVAKKNLLFSVLFQGQMCSIYLESAEKKRAYMLLKKSISENIQFRNVMSFPSITEKIWGFLTKVSLKNTCKLRNLLKIGL